MLWPRSSPLAWEAPGGVATSVSLGLLPKIRSNRWGSLRVPRGLGGGHAELWAQGGLRVWWLRGRAALESEGESWGKGPSSVGRRGRSESRSSVKIPQYSLAFGTCIPQSR